jgi:hypothetical protein
MAPSTANTYMSPYACTLKGPMDRLPDEGLGIEAN